MARALNRYRSAFYSGPVFFLAMMAALATAQASDFSVSPTQVQLGLNTSSEIVITNQSRDTVTLSVVGYAWSMNPLGRSELKPSDDVVVFPGIFKLAPLERQTLRVGVTTPPGAQERTYRIIVSELPSPQIKAATGGASIRILTAFSIPVFLSPLSSQTSVNFEHPRVSAGRFQFAIANTGTVHLPPAKMEITARDGSGRTLWSRATSAWYVLVGDQQNVSIPIPPSICASAKSFSVHLAAEEIRLDRTFADVAGCGA